MTKLPSNIDEALASPEHRGFLITLMGQGKRGMVYNESGDYSKAIACLYDVGLIDKEEKETKTIMRISHLCVQTMLDRKIIKRTNVPVGQRSMYKNNNG